MGQAEGYLKAPGNNYLEKYMPYFQKAMGLMGQGGGMFDPGNAGLGTFDPGNSGRGMFSVGDAGRGMFSVGNSGKGMYDVGNSGKGMYESGLLGDLYGRAQKNLANPESSLAYANAMDRISGQESGAMNSLNNNMAGWSRGSGIRLAAQQALQGTLAKTRADAARTTAAEAERNAVGDSMNISNLLGALFEQSKGRELQNTGLAANAFESAKGRELQNTGLAANAFENSMGRDLKNSDMSRMAFEDAMGRDLQNTGLSANAFENSRNRELSNTGLKATAYENAMDRARMLSGDSAGLLGGLANMMQWQAGSDNTSNQQTLNNLLGFNSTYNADKQGQFSRDQSDLIAKRNYAKALQSWKERMTATRAGGGKPAYGGYMGDMGPAYA
jgi:hypothetical protein